ncbi:hypothetical protein P7K49_027065, partial [Saguinus oedipus]
VRAKPFRATASAAHHELKELGLSSHTSSPPAFPETTLYRLKNGMERDEFTSECTQWSYMQLIKSVSFHEEDKIIIKPLSQSKAISNSQPYNHIPYLWPSVQGPHWLAPFNPTASPSASPFPRV